MVNDQKGRLSFTEDIAAFIRHLLDGDAAHGTYNFSNGGPVKSWADIAGDVYEQSGAARADVTGITTAEYFKDKAAAPRPLNSGLDLTKARSTGFEFVDADQRLATYLKLENDKA